MESIVRDVTMLDEAQRQALEQMLGHELCSGQQVVIQVVDASRGDASDRRQSSGQTLEDWTGVYGGLTEDQIEEIDEIVKTRANLTRDDP